MKEYVELVDRIRMLFARIGVRAVDVEKAAFVLMKEPKGDVQEVETDEVEQASVETILTAKPKQSLDGMNKRKVSNKEGMDVPVRRSKRGKT
jgi:hypothetical protein